MIPARIKWGDIASGPIPIPLIVDQVQTIIAYECRTGFSPSVTLIGNSLGAWIALLYALKHPDRVERLVLESGGGLMRALASPPEFAILPLGASWSLLRHGEGP